MIPQRIKLSGFLSYRDEQEIPFAGSAVWMLAGVNGSGKSSVFDAVTYAFFGHHRGGSQNAIELINKSEVKEGAKAQLKMENDRLHAKAFLPTLFFYFLLLYSILFYFLFFSFILFYFILFLIIYLYRLLIWSS